MATKKPDPKAVRANAVTKRQTSSTFAFPPVAAIALIVVAWIATRYWAAGAGLKWISYPHGDQLYGDVATYDFWGSNMLNKVFPFSSGIPENQAWTNDAWQYPPLAAWIFMLGYKLHAGLIGFIQLALVADLSILGMLLWFGRARRDDRGAQITSANYTPALIWLSAPIFIGPLILGRFDVFPTMAIIAALLAVSSSRRFGIWTAIGTMLKAWPVLGLLAVSRKSFKEAFLWFVGASVLLSAVLTAWWPKGLSAFFSGQGQRGLQIESIGALPYMMFGQADNQKAIIFQYGAWQVVGKGTNLVSLALTIAFFVWLALIAVWRWQGRLESIPRFDIALMTVLISLVTSRVLSPQYSVWIFGLLAVAAFTPQRRFWLIATLLATSVAFGQILFPWKYSDFQLLHTNGVMIQTIRVACLIAATVICWKNILDRLEPPSRSNETEVYGSNSNSNSSVNSETKTTRNISLGSKK